MPGRAGQEKSSHQKGRKEVPSLGLSVRRPCPSHPACPPSSLLPRELLSSSGMRAMQWCWDRGQALKAPSRAGEMQGLLSNHQEAQCLCGGSVDVRAT